MLLIIQQVAITFFFSSLWKNNFIIFLENDLFSLSKIKTVLARTEKKVKRSQNSTKDSHHVIIIEHSHIYAYIFVFHVM